MTDFERVIDLQQSILRELNASYHLGPPREYGPRIGSADDAYGQVADMALLAQEQCRVLCLTARNDLIQIVTVAMGAGNKAIVRPRDVFRPAIECGAMGVIFCHNHPSGDPAPSPEDVSLTNELMQAGKILGVDVLDHIVVGNGRWRSIRSMHVLAHSDQGSAWDAADSNG